MIRTPSFFRVLTLTALTCGAVLFAGPVARAERTPPPPIAELQNPVRTDTAISIGVTEGLPLDIRFDAMKEAALSYGARGGLAWRTWEIRNELENTSDYMDKVFDFRQLLIAAPSGLLIEPPIVSEQENALLIEAGGQSAAVSDRVYSISANAKIVATARVWRNYLERDWGKVAPPPDVLLPETPEEKERWANWVQIGWERGVEQADEIFQADLQALSADYQGMVRYRMLLAQDMVSQPYALHVDRGVTGGGDVMRVGDRAVQITGKPELKPGSDTWLPASR
ncbi:type IV secretion system DotC family protein [Micavibrio aeruginosavorus]|uniref:Type IV secretion system protein DotC n=1 Tax=Micavibrio aeruginosavorus (strain ARL-13) TaxID=856793 RepID=G2KNU5_MICAA|nr:type IV secretion system DotC family protein [Micavibrio aeruginosavorus]AEP10740.1 hypothetical protein MICA_2438 [Micavibrio aeruginosavorus ARL-13]